MVSIDRTNTIDNLYMAGSDGKNMLDGAVNPAYVTNVTPKMSRPSGGSIMQTSKSMNKNQIT